MLTQRADANGRDTPGAGKVSWRLSGARSIRAADPGSLRWTPTLGGSNSAWSTRSLRPIDPGEPSSNLMPRPPSRNDRHNLTATGQGLTATERRLIGPGYGLITTDQGLIATDR